MNDYERKILYYLAVYHNVNQTRELTDKDQLALRCWYRHKLNMSRGWITYWIKLSTYKPDFFIKNIQSLIKFSSWRDVITVLNGTPSTVCQETICNLIRKELTLAILNNDTKCLVANFLPIKKKNIPFAYNFLLSYFKQTPSDWRKMIVSLRKDFCYEESNIKDKQDFSWKLHFDDDNFKISIFYNPNDYPIKLFIDDNNNLIIKGSSSSLKEWGLLLVFQENYQQKNLIKILLEEYYL